MDAKLSLSVKQAHPTANVVLPGPSNRGQYGPVRTNQSRGRAGGRSGYQGGRSGYQQGGSQSITAVGGGRTGGRGSPNSSASNAGGASGWQQGEPKFCKYHNNFVAGQMSAGTTLPTTLATTTLGKTPM